MNYTDAINKYYASKGLKPPGMEDESQLATSLNAPPPPPPPVTEAPIGFTGTPADAGLLGKGPTGGLAAKSGASPLPVMPLNGPNGIANAPMETPQGPPAKPMSTMDKLAQWQKSGPVTEIAPVIVTASPTGSLASKYGGAKATPKEPQSNVDKFLTATEKKEAGLMASVVKKDTTASSDIMDAQTRLAEYKKNITSGAQDYLEEYDQKVADIQAEKRRFVDQALTTQAAQTEALSNTKIDPNRIWATADAGESALAFVSIFLSGLAGNGTNKAMESFERTIDRDIASQKDNLSNKWAGLSEQKGLMAQRVAAFGDEEMAAVSAKMGYLQTLDYQIQARALQTDSDVAQIQAKRASEMIGERVSGLGVELEKIADARATAFEQKKLAVANADRMKIEKRNEKLWEGNKGVLEELGKKLAAEGVPTQMTLQKDGPMKGMPVLVDMQGNVIADATSVGVKSMGASGKGVDVPTVTQWNNGGKPVYGAATKFTTPEAANQFRTKQEAMAKIETLLGRMKALHSKAGVVWDSAAEKKEAASLSAQLSEAYATAQKMGAISEGFDKTTLEAVVPTASDLLDHNWFGSDGVNAAIESLETSTLDDWSNTLAGYGVNVPDNLPTVNAPPGTEFVK